MTQRTKKMDSELPFSASTALGIGVWVLVVVVLVDVVLRVVVGGSVTFLISTGLLEVTFAAKDGSIGRLLVLFGAGTTDSLLCCGDESRAMTVHATHAKHASKVHFITIVTLVV